MISETLAGILLCRVLIRSGVRAELDRYFYFQRSLRSFEVKHSFDVGLDWRTSEADTMMNFGIAESFASERMSDGTP